MQGQAAAKVLSPAEMAEYEEKKLKMRKAMGENLHDDVQGRDALSAFKIYLGFWAIRVRVLG